MIKILLYIRFRTSSVMLRSAKSLTECPANGELFLVCELFIYSTMYSLNKSDDSARSRTVNLYLFVLSVAGHYIVNNVRFFIRS